LVVGNIWNSTDGYVGQTVNAKAYNKA